jgi:hypothetical protein
MRKFFKIISWLPVCIVLYACPYESPVALDDKPTEPVDSSLLGYWYGIVKDGSDYFGIEALDIQKLSDSTYDITRYGKAIKGDMILPDTSHFKGFVSRVNDQRFMNIETTVIDVIQVPKKKPEVKTSTAYYIAAITLFHDTLTVATVTDGFSGKNPNFKTPDVLRKTVSSLAAQKKNIFDDVYKLSYRKTPKPG